MLSTKWSQVQASATLAIDAKLKAMRASGIDVVGFGAGEPDFDTPDNVKMAAINAIVQGHTKYTPSSGTAELRTVVAQKLWTDNALDYDASQIIISNGAKHALYNAFCAILNPNDGVILPTPCWVSYPEMVALADGSITYLPTTEANGFKFTAAELEQAIQPNSKVLLLNSPSNPTGMVYTKQELEDIAAVVLKHNLYVISDEIYEKLIYGDTPHISIASLSPEIKERTIVVNGLSKSASMTGWRIGYTASNKQIAAVINNVQSHATSNPCSISQYAAVEAVRHNDAFSAQMRDAFRLRRDFLHAEINGIPGLSCLLPDGAFYIFMNMSDFVGKRAGDIRVTDSMTFCEALLSEGRVAAVPGTPFGAPNHVRLSYCTSMENISEGVNRIRAFAERVMNS